MRDVPEYDSFEDMMGAHGRLDWLSCPPPDSLGRYFNNWKYVTNNLVAIEQVITERIKGKSKSVESAGRACFSISGSSSKHLFHTNGPTYIGSNSSKCGSTASSSAKLSQLHAHDHIQPLNPLATIVDSVGTTANDDSTANF